ncbi:hypothetical protein AHiyo8_15180 [Arthrobacter sp. Hiyo8]|nr:hypothetical protein AHiyo8_15180 [Arthrobacter sp. Hiyo8]
MNNVIFWIIVCSWLIPMGIRMYNRSRQRRLRDFPPQDYPGSLILRRITRRIPGATPGHLPG